jgi:hypothetical protein
MEGTASKKWLVGILLALLALLQLVKKQWVAGRISVSFLVCKGNEMAEIVSIGKRKESVFPPLKLERVLTILTNKLWQRWCIVISETRS